MAGRSGVAGPSPPRRSLFDSLPVTRDQNLYCRRDTLTNEASVEQFFVNRMLADLGYRDSQIKPKHSIAELTVSLGGARTERYKPDYVLTLRKKPRWIIDAKSPNEEPEKWIPQCGGYCLGLNQSFENENPVGYFILTNGLITYLHRWDNRNPLLEIDFAEFHLGNPKYEQLRSLLAPNTLDFGKAPEGNTFIFERPTSQLTKTLFASCHRAIWKGEGSSPTSAFLEFTKLMFVKLWCDRKLREDPEIKALLENAEGSRVKLPKGAVMFSTQWLDANSVSASPLNDLLFATLRRDIEKDIADRKKKRIFGRDEVIDLRPDTIRAVVEKLQHYDMFGVDEDLNGRLFEAFLNATMRGKELGQYFTPRSVVKLITRLADLKVSPAVEPAEKVLDGCCGTGGFLIEALTEMRNAVRDNRSLTLARKEELIEQICNESIYGIDFGKSPPIARIARINMYLHGDGGSRIYAADALDKRLESPPGQDIELTRDQGELRVAVAGGLKFHVVLTNPPFSMTKELNNETEARVLRQYDLAKIPNTTRVRSSLRSNSMFIERYHDLLEDGGRLLTVIDDSLLAGDEFGFVRDFIRSEFIVRAIISLPGDAFQRSGARAKTSVLYLTKRHRQEGNASETEETADEGQPDIFVYECRYVGLDDVVLRTRPSVADAARNDAIRETNYVFSEFQKYLAGERGSWLVPATSLGGRLDAKYLRPWRASELEHTWHQVGASSDIL